jgi:hypothetical protein
MDARYYFVLGSKLIGLYCLVLALIYFVPVIGSIFTRSIYAPEDVGYVKIVFFALILVPVLLAGIGFYLMRDGALVHNLAFPEDSSNLTLGMESVFTLAIKLYGVFLVTSSIPNLMRIFSNFVFVANLRSPSRDIIADFMGINRDFLPSLVSILLGVYFLLRGETITELAFRKPRVIESED